MAKRTNGLPFPIKMIDIDRLKPAAYNPRRISEHDMAALVRSLKRFGVVDPVIIRGEDQMIVGGHQRVEAAREAGIAEVPCVVLDELSENDAKLLNLALNRISGEWDDARLSSLMIELKELGAELELSGFDGEELAGLLDLPPGQIEGQEFDESAEAEVIKATCPKCGEMFPV